MGKVLVDECLSQRCALPTALTCCCMSWPSRRSALLFHVVQRCQNLGGFLCRYVMPQRDDAVGVLTDCLVAVIPHDDFERIYRTPSSDQSELPRVCRRLFGLSHAVDHEGHVDEARPGHHISEVGEPQRIRILCLELPIDVVLWARRRLVADCGPDRLAANRALQAAGASSTRRVSCGLIHLGGRDVVSTKVTEA